MMKRFRYIETTSDNRIATVWLNRPRIHNAMNAGMVAELHFIFNHYGNDEQIDIVVLRGRGDSFSSGADLNYMKEQSMMTEQENYEDALRLSEMFHSVYACPKIVISLVHGHVAGGGNGLVAASDYVIASDSTVFRFSELRLGIIPAVISPYIVGKTGFRHAREMFFTGRAYSAREAVTFGLANEVCGRSFMDEVLKKVTDDMVKSSPSALRSTKHLLIKMEMIDRSGELFNYTSRMLADARYSDEGREGIASFLEKRSPYWLKGKE